VCKQDNESVKVAPESVLSKSRRYTLAQVFTGGIICGGYLRTPGSRRYGQDRAKIPTITQATAALVASTRDCRPLLTAPSQLLYFTPNRWRSACNTEQTNQTLTQLQVADLEEIQKFLAQKNT